MSKYNLNKVLDDTRKLYKTTPSTLANVGLGSSLHKNDDTEFIIMPEWWQKGTNTKGLPFGRLVMIAGDSDSGKTSAAIEAMKAAQAQGVAVLYVETENKTTEEDLKSYGIDTEQIMLVRESLAEKAYEAMFALWEVFFDNYPTGKLLVIVDSIGNVLSLHDVNLNLTDGNQKPGGKGKTNRLALNKMIVKTKIDSNKVAILLSNYTYDNIGSPGKTNAGGKALNFFSSLTYQTTRKQWLERTVKGEKVRYGARVQWRLFKNHLNKSSPGPKTIELDITSQGIRLVGDGE